MDDRERVRWARALTTVGWLFVVAYIGYLTSQIRRAFAINDGSFEDGIWGQRIEQVSFAALPQNLIIMVPAAAAGALATMLVAGRADRTEMWLTQMVRIVAGISYMAIVLAALGIIGVLFRTPDSVGDVAALTGRGGGILIAIAMLRLCLEAERSA